MAVWTKRRVFDASWTSWTSVPVVDGGAGVALVPASRSYVIVSKINK
jgi:hypothetical protein